MIAGISFGGLLLISLLWTCSCIISRRYLRKKDVTGLKASNQPVISHSSSSPYEPSQPPPYNSPEAEPVDVNTERKAENDSPPLTPLCEANDPKELPDRLKDADIEMGRLEPASAPNPPMPVYQRRPMSRLTPINTRSLHDSLLVYPPRQLSQRLYDPYAQVLSEDQTPTDTTPPQYYSPFSPPQKPYAHLSIQFPYAQSPIKYESPTFPESQAGAYKAYSPSLGPQHKSSHPNSSAIEPIELASPFNQRPQSIPMGQDSQTHVPTQQHRRVGSPQPVLTPTVGQAM